MANHDVYEGDDINIITPMIQLDSALAGKLDIYRYPWQPLTYWLGAGLVKLFGSPAIVYLLAPLAATVSLGLLILFTANTTKKHHSIFVYICFLIFIPELFYSGLYFNATIVAMPFVIFSALLLQTNSSAFSTLLAGILTGLAILMRLDFILACPMLLVITWYRNQSLKLALILVSTVLTVLGLALFFELVSLDRIISDFNIAHEEIVAKAHDPGWNLRSKLFVLSIAMYYPAVLVLLPFAVINFYQNEISQKKYFKLIFILAILPLLYPFTSLLSVKYLLPLYIFLPVCFLYGYEYLSELIISKYKKDYAKTGVFVAAILALLVSIELQNKSPFIRCTLFEARRVGTHDGARSYGAYLVQTLGFYRIRDVNFNFLAAEEIIDFLKKQNGSDILFVGKENIFSNGGIGWRATQLLAETNHIHGQVIGDHLISFDFGPHHLWLAENLDNANDNIKQSQHKPLIIDLGSQEIAAQDAYAIVHALLNKPQPD